MTTRHLTVIFWMGGVSPIKSFAVLSRLNYLAGLEFIAAVAEMLTTGLGAIVVMYVGLLAGEGSLVVAASRACQK